MYEQGKFTPGAYQVCDGCHAPFPKSFFITRGAIKEGSHNFCEEQCRKTFHIRQTSQGETTQSFPHPQPTPITQLELTMLNFRPFVKE